MSEVHESGYLK
ncbi:hypothetical protein F383_37411 [Gossypium arboreum]|uniref:Uncharacterized protein n=1 Tax=Gossypium arboreum TaxID=29729 RepID=A0A0B0MBP4_GOSAR|nr:hypothetical protein F383_37411 [Gossypium arboreum]